MSDLAILEEVYSEDHYDINKFIQPGFKVLEIGAHIGIFSLLAANRVGRDGFVLSIEASPQNFELLDKNRRANPHVPLKIMNIAAADKVGEVSVYHSNWNTGGHRTGKAQGFKNLVLSNGLSQLLDRMPAGEVDVLKIDCEGCEFSVIEGADTEILRRIRLMIIEFHCFDGENCDRIDSAQIRLQNAGFHCDVISDVFYPKEGYFQTVIARRRR
ncbi:FkbM family methyltransferase [Pseudovibrio sp. Ad26]|uniref:FkbM family methyltransferase n=1 Tax=Pseudovibrio sp. Ad26 TaxID=989410 RepID=UPI00187C955A|nr:FkbM family methyltransferase [Pseudovibrio sp. Ad26]